MTEKQIQKLVSKQREYFYSGATLSYSQRITALTKLRESINQHEDEIYTALKIDLNKPKMESYLSEILLVMMEIKLALKKLKKWMKPTRVKAGVINFGSQATIQQDPYGVSLIISPWNYPLQLALAPLVGAISGGNTAILKTSELAPATSKVIKKIITSSFKEEYITVVEGKVKEATLLLQQKFDFIFFTGSTPVGKIVMSAAAQHLTPVVLELGGKSPCIIGPTANIKKAAKRIAWGKLLNAGQTCVAPDYIYIHESRKDYFIKNYILNIKKFYGDEIATSEDFCKIINLKNFQRLQALIASEEIVHGGKGNSKTLHFPPTIIENPKIDSPLRKEEIFGPILPIITFQKMEEIPRHIRKTGKPLALYIFSEDKEFNKYILNHTSSGGVCINDTISHLTAENLPFGGVGESGSGNYHGKKTFLAFTHAKSILTKKGIDPPMKFPPYKKKDRWIKWMKKIFMIIFMLTALSPIKGFSSPYKTFHKKLKAKSYNSALRTIRSLYNQETQNGKYKYWYGYTLYKAKKYNRAIKIFNLRPHDYRPLSRAYHLGSAYEKIKQYRKGINFLKLALKLKETRPGYHNYFYRILIRLIDKTNNVKELDKILPAALIYYANYKGEKHAYFFYKVGRFYLKTARTSLKKKQWKKAFTFYRKCLPFTQKRLGRYQKYLNPDRFCSDLFRLKKYNKVIRSFSMLPKKSQTIKAQLLNLRSCFALGKKEQSITRLNLLIKNQGNYFNRYNWEQTIALLSRNKNKARILKLEYQIRRQYLKEKKELSAYLNYRFTKARIAMLSIFISENKNRKALRYIKEIRKAYSRKIGKYQKYIKLDQVKFLEKVIRYWSKNKSRAKSSYQHKFLVTVFSDSNVKFTNQKGKRIHVIDHIPQTQLALYKNSLQTLRRIYFYYTRSKVDLSFKMRYLNSTITKVRSRVWNSQKKDKYGRFLETRQYYHPILSSIKPNPWGEIYRKRNDYDSHILVFPSKGITRTSNGGRTKIIYVPGFLKSKVTRGRIIIASTSFSDQSYRLLTHELFHCMESAYYRNYHYPAHAWRKQYKHLWPRWYHGEIELEYYEMVFKRYFRPNGIREINFKAKKDYTSKSQFQQAKNKLAKQMDNN